MNVFDIIGPIMIGPSSSHTAGAVKIGRVARQLFGSKPSEAVITLHGSFAETGRGHGTDLAIIAGLLELPLDDERIRESMKLAYEAGLSVSFKTEIIKNAHPNTAQILLSDGLKSLSVVGSSIGGGRIVINKINNLDVEFTGEYNTIVVGHQDAPGVVASVTSLLAENKINIANMKVYRSHHGGKAIMIIETDEAISNALRDSIDQMNNVHQTTVIRPI